MDLNILPPDDQTFIKKKEVSTRQREHLTRARQVAKQKIQAQRDRENQNQSVKSEDEEENNENEENFETPLTNTKLDKKFVDKCKPKERKPREKKTIKDEYKFRTEEEIEEKIEVEKFSKFMKQMKKYEETKERMRQEEEDKNKIHIKYTQEEYDELLELLNVKSKEEEKPVVSAENPVEDKKINKNVIPQIDYNNYLGRFTQGRNRTRFGK